MPAYEQAAGIVRPGGVIRWVGVPWYDRAPVGLAGLFGPDIPLRWTRAPRYIEELLPAVLDGTVKLGKVFDRTIGLENFRRLPTMERREALKVLTRP